MRARALRRHRPLINAALALAMLALAGCGGSEGYGDPWTSRAQEERLGSEGERDPETAEALRERLRYNQADR